ncbi:MAG: thioredoxin [Moorea sp. SIO2B7]|nr:thioredoxin [Moorena sp. SIO2B7]
MVLSVTQQTFSKEVLESPYPVLVNFWAPWCGLCLMINPILLKFQSQGYENVKVISINADENFIVSNTYHLKSLPTLILFEGGRIVQRLEGFHSREELHRTLDQMMVNLLARSA